MAPGIEDATAAQFERCRVLAEGVPLPWPFSHQALADAVGGGRGRVISLRAIPLSLDAEASASVIAIDDSVFIAYPFDNAPWFQTFTVCVGLAHVIAGHLPIPGDGSGRIIPGGRCARWWGEPSHHGLRVERDVAVTVLAGPASRQEAEDAECIASSLMARIEQFVELSTGGAPIDDPPETIRARVEILRQHWSRLVAAMPETSPWPDAVRRIAATSDELRWQQQRLVIEIHDAHRQLSAHVTGHPNTMVEEAVKASGLVGDEAEAAIESVWLSLGLGARAEAQPPGSWHREPQIPGHDSVAAARYLARQLALVQQPHVAEVIRVVQKTCHAIALGCIHRCTDSGR